MMLLSRFWYAVLAVLAGFAVYSLMLAVGQYNRVSVKGTNEALAGDSNVVRWALQIDSRRRVDALMALALDKSIQDSLVATIDKDKIPQKSRDDSRKALSALQDKIPSQYKPDATFVVDRDGRVIAEIGFPQADKFDDFELGGYSAVNDALHGWLRDDTWVWGGQMYRVGARPVEYDVAQPPVGAIVGLRAIDRSFATTIVKDTHTNVVFYALGQRIAGAGIDGFDEGLFDQILPELPKLDNDATYKEKGHTEIRDLNPTLGAVFAKLDGDAFELGGGFAVMRPRVMINGSLAFLNGADDADKKNVSWSTIAGIVVAGLVFGLLLTFLEHDRPSSKLRAQALKFKKGETDALHLAQLSGGLRDVAADINAGIDRLAEKGGGSVRKPADLEAILGPVPTEPAMSAFAFPLDGRGSNPPPSAPKGPITLPHSVPHSPATSPIIAKAAGRPVSGGFPSPQLQQPETSPTQVMPMRQSDGPAQPMIDPRTGPGIPRPSGPGVAVPPAPVTAPLLRKKDEEQEEQTTVAAVPQEVLARAIGEANADEGEWPSVYEDFVKTKKQCNEPTEGLTFDKFRQTLRKNRDALVQRHNCKRVKFTVYVKDGRASLKATPIKD